MNNYKTAQHIVITLLPSPMFTYLAESEFRVALRARR